MTYIIAGKVKQSTFLMSDCISKHSSSGKKSFSNKLVNLDSSKEEYYSFTGCRFIDNCVRCYDYWLSIKNRNNDFIDGDKSMLELKSVIGKFIETYPVRNELKLGKNRLFFLNKNNVVFYDLEFDNKNEFENDPIKQVLQMDYFVDSVINFPPERIKLDLNISIEEYCKKHLISISQGEDLKDRFSFIQLFEDGNFNFKHPYKMFSDIVSIYNEMEFENIDNEKFKWDI